VEWEKDMVKLFHKIYRYWFRLMKYDCLRSSEFTYHDYFSSVIIRYNINFLFDIIKISLNLVYEVHIRYYLAIFQLNCNFNLAKYFMGPVICKKYLSLFPFFISDKGIFIIGHMLCCFRINIPWDIFATFHN